MVQIDIDYRGNLRCGAVHGPSKTTLLTDAPVDNHGKGESFSPTDLVATALGTCMATTMAILAERLNVDLAGTTFIVQKEMASQPVRRISRLTVQINAPARVAEEHRRRLEAAALGCPVRKSIHGDVEVPLTIQWDR